MPQPTIVLIADYGTGDASFTEVTLQLQTLIPEAVILPQSVPAFSTLATGFLTYQIALTPNLVNIYLYTNTAPRIEDTKAQVNNRGEKLVYAKLKNGREIIGVNAKYCFSFVKPHIEAFHLVNIENEGSQFRSRDKYPKAVSQMVKKDTSFIGEAMNPTLIPDFPPQSVAMVDGYGNIKTTIRRSEVTFTPGQKLIISFKNTSHESYFTDGTFNVPHGSLSFAQGSSGHEDRFMEIFYRGASAAELFGGVRVEDEFTIRGL
ncbi:MAG: SAM-dependent chlorinase/fluorinase [Candidatus Levybacteria bacterium]|nr:SAM-dependent chlorinase/fluorinase [Candidatus Levybacteria bacterium]